ncbi:MAG TPA: DUF389 domain-containing protein [Prolixibacteraceae bacterium]|nr:MAG: hypothetical protein A2066_15185 [Bacteroidetes bacterium GWB2_41_8]HCY41372.1 DUF389 domain-containing protein [Prolixibacteraceae bacterium]
MKHSQLISKILNYIELDSEVDNFDKIHEAIEKDLIFKGTNLWILAFAIIVASVGLNMNSTAVIIGAMLISPLMGPINGMGYSIATYNFQLFKQALKNFIFAVSASLIASTTYFLISPISTAHSELLARTSPTIYDVLIALFGGLAGIVAISSKQKGNVIPGVAIATALMPPLCTAGYGLATLQFSYLFGALYLFTINAVFIAISSVIVSQILKFPIRTLVDAGQKKRVNQWISFVIILVLIPSIYFGYVLVMKEKFIERGSEYVSYVSIAEGNYLLKSEINPDKETITLIYGGVSLSDTQKDKIKENAKLFDLENAKIEFQQGFSFDQITRKNSEIENLSAEINRLSQLLKTKEEQLEIISNKNDMGKQILDEIKVLYPQITSCTYAESNVFNSKNTSSQKVIIIAFKTDGKGILNHEKKKIEDWLIARLKSNSLKIFFEN